MKKHLKKKKIPLLRSNPMNKYLSSPFCGCDTLQSPTWGNAKTAIALNNQKINNHSFNCVDKVAVSGNNARQELRNLFKSVQHHTIVGVFLCLSFNNLSFTGKLYLALALVRFWQGGRGNKPFIGRIPCAVDLAVSNLLAALHLGQSSKKLPFEKV